ncbi:MAG: exosortase/archaeosortase family protein [Desulfopila sp.]
MMNILRLDRRNSLYGIVLCIALIWLYFPFVKTMVHDWGTNDDYSHGYFIPFLCAYFIYSMRDQLQKLDVRPKNIGLVLLLLGLAQLFVAKVGSELFLQRTSLILVLLGLILFLLGWAFFKKLFLPICYLLFMVPLPAIIWNKIAFPMQLFASAMTEKVVYVLGIPIYREGNVLHLAQAVLEVVAACSGLRSLMTMFALSGALVLISPLLPKWKKWVLFFSAAPVAIVANIIRLTSTAVLATHYGADVALGFLHEASGLVVFLLGFAMLMTIYVAVSRKKAQ